MKKKKYSFFQRRLSKKRFPIPIKLIQLQNASISKSALKQDECNAKVEVTEKTGLEVVNTESFDVNVCLKEIYKVIN